MNHELELNRNDQMVSLDRETLRSLQETFQLFVEDFETSYRAAKDLAAEEVRERDARPGHREGGVRAVRTSRSRPASFARG